MISVEMYESKRFTLGIRSQFNGKYSIFCIRPEKLSVPILTKTDDVLEINTKREARKLFRTFIKLIGHLKPLTKEDKELLEKYNVSEDPSEFLCPKFLKIV